MAKVQKVRKSKIRKKKWYPILATKEFGERVVGETLVYDASELIGRCITVNLMSLTNDFKKQNIHIQFLISGLKGQTATTKLRGYKVIDAAIKRLVRRKKNSVNYSFMLKTADNASVRIKPFIVTRLNICKSVLTDLRKGAREYLVRYAKKKKFGEIITDLVSNRLQREMKSRLSKIYPLKAVEIRKMKLMGQEETGEIEVEAPKEEPKPEVKAEKPEPKEEVKPEIKEEKKE